MSNVQSSEPYQRQACYALITGLQIAIEVNVRGVNIVQYMTASPYVLASTYSLLLVMV